MKKKMDELKRRMKLGGTSKAGKSKTAELAPTTLDSDVDAEGDIDVDE